MPVPSSSINQYGQWSPWQRSLLPGAGNMGKDMISGIKSATGCLVSVRLTNDYEANNYDSEGYRTGTLGQIGFDIKKLLQKSTN